MSEVICSEPVVVLMLPPEAKILDAFLLSLGKNAHALKAHAPHGHFVLYDWYVKDFLKWSISVGRKNPKTPYKCKIPLGIALLLCRELQAPIDIRLQIVLSGLHKALINRGFIEI